MLTYLVGLLIVGLVVGGLARLVVPGRNPMGIGMTILIGIAGSYVAGVLVWTFHGRGGTGFVLSVLCSIGLVYLVRRSRDGPGPRRPAARDLPPRRRYW